MVAIGVFINMTFCNFVELFWTAPEVLHEKYESFLSETSNMRGISSVADIYSCGVIFKELFCRNEAYTEHDHMNPKGTPFLFKIKGLL